MKNSMNITILVVEDDPAQFNWMEECLLERFPELTIEQESTELGFRRRVERTAPPHAVIVDVMLPWTVPARDLEDLPDESWTFMKAGFRCVEFMRAHPQWRDVPALLYSVLKRDEIGEDMPPDAAFLLKGKSESQLATFVERSASRL
jgi:CheY-like chemotaxis protein